MRLHTIWREIRRPDPAGRSGDALAFVAGLLLVGAFAPFELRFLSLLAPAGLFLLWRNTTPRRAAWRGWLFGVGMFGAGVSWVYFSIHHFGAAIAPLAALITLVFVLAMALFPAALGWGAARLSTGRAATDLVLLFPALWALAEWWRGWFLTGFPWLLLGHAQVDTALGGYAPVAGSFGTGLAAAVCAGSLAWFAVADARRLRVAALGLFVSIGVGGALLGRIDWTEAAGDPLTVSVVQGNVEQERKFGPDALVNAIDLYWTLTASAPRSDLVVWPETALPTFYDMAAAEFLVPAAERLRGTGGDLLTGIFAHDPESGAYYNSVVRPAEAPAFYHKRQLVVFGEYLPLRGLFLWLERWVDIPMSDLAPGAGRPLIEAAGRPIGVSICFEAAFGNQVIEALPEAQLLVNVSNDAWFGDSIAPHQHLEIARSRALETGRYLIRATNTGISAVIGPRGEIVARSPQFEVHVLTAEAVPRSGMTPYARLGDWPAVLAAFVMLVASVVRGKRCRPDILSLGP